MTALAPELSPEVAEQLDRMRTRLDTLEVQLRVIDVGVAELLCRVPTNAPGTARRNGSGGWVSPLVVRTSTASAAHPCEPDSAPIPRRGGCSPTTFAWRRSSPHPWQLPARATTRSPGEAWTTPVPLGGLTVVEVPLTGLKGAATP